MIKNKNTKLKLVAIACIIAILGLGASFLLNRGTRQIKTDQSSTVSSGINYGPPTEQEKAETEVHKNSLGESSQPTNTSNGKKQVAPIITSVDKREISAYISGVFEEGGTCTATLTKDGKTVTKTSIGFGNVSYTSCEPITVDGSLDKGSWSVVVSYDSKAAEGQSQPKVFTVE